MQEPVDFRFDDVRLRGTRVPGRRSSADSGVEQKVCITSLHLGEHWLLFIADGSSLTCYPNSRRRSSPDDLRFRAFSCVVSKAKFTCISELPSDGIRGELRIGKTSSNSLKNEPL